MKRLALVLGLVLLAVPPAAHAQLGTGRLAGTIRDERGQPLKGATVSAENETFFPRSLTSATDARGRFSILGLRTTTYKITVRAEGFEVATFAVPVRASAPNGPIDLRLIRKIEPGPPPVLGNADAGRVQADLDEAAGLASAGNLDGAIAAYRKVLKDAPALTSVHLQLGYLYETKGDRASALAAYGAALKADPSSVTARDGVKRLRPATR